MSLFPSLQTQLSRFSNSILGEFSSDTRLYDFSVQDKGEQTEFKQDFGSGGLLVEGFAATESLHNISVRDVILLSTNPSIKLSSLLTQTASLHISLSDGTRSSFTGLIQQVANLGSDGALARYRVRLVPWLWLLTQVHTSRVWQDKTVIEIIESIFSKYSSHAAWTWSEDVTDFMRDARPRSYVAQYRESDYDFVRRLLTEEGLSWRVEEDTTAPSGHKLIFFADSTHTSATPEDATSQHSLGGAGIRFHGASSREQQDSIQALGAKRQLTVALTTVLSMDYKSKQAVTASVPTHHQYGGKNVPVIESYDTPGLYAYADAAQAERYARLQQEAHEARNKTWIARSTVRTLRPGTRFTLSQGPLDIVNNAANTPPELVVLNVTSIGINNLPKAAKESLAELFGSIPQLLTECLNSAKEENGSDGDYGSRGGKNSVNAGSSRQSNDGFNDDNAFAQALQKKEEQQQLRQVITQATTLGYANHFTAIRSDIPWRPVAWEETDVSGSYNTSHNAKPTALGSQTAIVVGADGQDQPNGADEIYCDRLGRVRIRFHWQGQQDDANATCWVRVAQRSAGNGMGAQFLPRIGQEVVVQFIEGDIDRPIIVAALYNGQGEGGSAPTPGGQTMQDANITIFDAATDHQPSGQGNLAAGNSPVWHGASAGSAGHNNPSAQWGIRSKEFGGNGYNQLNFDDTDQQARIQLKTTQAGTELNLGHLIHTADNYRGSFRGLGAELRTDAYGALRAGAGLHLSSYPISHNANQRDYAADNTAGMALLKQAASLAKSFSDAAKTHQTVELASHIGSLRSYSSSLDPRASPIKALHTAASGMLSAQSEAQAKADAADKNTAPNKDTLPHSTDPIISLSAKAGLSMTAGQNIQFANGETTTFLSGQDTQLHTGNQFRLQTGQAIGILGGVVKPGEQQIGLQLIAAKDNIDLQAQSDQMQIQARDEINILSSHAHIDWAAAKSISLSTADGANITIKDGNITVQCPGKILVKAGKKSFVAGDKLDYPLPVMPKSICVECLLKARAAAAPFALK